MSVLKNCLKWAEEAWPVIKTSMQEAMESPWRDTTHALEDKAGALLQPFKALVFSPEEVLRSEHALPLVKPLLDADANSKITAGEFLREHVDLLKKITPNWEGAKKEDYNHGLSTLWTEYINGRINTKNLPEEARGDFAKLKGWFVDKWNKIPQIAALPKGGFPLSSATWTLDDDLVGPTIKVLADPKNPNAALAGLVKVVPKETAYKLMRDGNSKNVTGLDWVRLAVPMAARKEAFDPVITQMREAIPKLGKVEARYTERLIDRIVGKKTNMQELVDDGINHIRSLAGFEEVKFSPSAKWAGGMSKLLFDGALAYNPGAALLNITQIINQASRDGLMPTLEAFAKSRSTIGRELAAERLALGDFDKFFFRSSDETALKRGYEKFQHVGYKMFDGAENFMRGLGFHAGLSRWMKENNVKSLEEFMSMRGTDLFHDGLRAGQESAAETYFMYSAVHQSPYMSSPFSKLLFQFTSFPLRQTEFMLKQIRSDNRMFMPRFLGYTGFASGMAYYGAGLAIGDQMGGAGSWPIAKEYLDKGDITSASLAAVGGLAKGTVGRYLADTHSVSRGISPFGGILIDTLNLPIFGGGGKNPEEAYAKWARSMMIMMPAGLEIKRLSEATINQFQNGERHKPEGIAQGFSIPTAMSAISKELFDEPIPGVSPRFTGSYAEDVSGLESVARSAGLRTRKAEMDFRFGRDEAIENQESRDARKDPARRAAAALLNGTAEEFSNAITEAMSSGAFADSKSLHQSIEAAIERQLLTDKQRAEKRSPIMARVKRALE